MFTWMARHEGCIFWFLQVLPLQTGPTFLLWSSHANNGSGRMGTFGMFGVLHFDHAAGPKEEHVHCSWIQNPLVPCDCTKPRPSVKERSHIT